MVEFNLALGFITAGNQIAVPCAHVRDVDRTDELIDRCDNVRSGSSTPLFGCNGNSVYAVLIDGDGLRCFPSVPQVESTRAGRKSYRTVSAEVGTSSNGYG